MTSGLHVEPLGRELADVAAVLRRSTVEVRTRGTGVGSGIVWDTTGTIVTNAHVARADHATVVLSDGRELAGVVTARDPRRDLALITVDVAGTPLPAATVGHPTDLRTGDLVLALGTGGVSIAALQIAKANGARVAITSSSERLAAIASLTL